MADQNFPDEIFRQRDLLAGFEIEPTRGRSAEDGELHHEVALKCM